MIRAPLEIYANRSGIGLAAKICEELTKLRAGRPPEEQDSCDTRLKLGLVRPGKEMFASGEFKVTLEDSVRGKNIFLVQCAIDRSERTRSIQDNIWETLETIEALKGCHAQYTTLIMPCLPYSKQDKVDGRESYGAVTLAQALSAMGLDQLITFDLHSEQIKGFYRMAHIPLDSHHITNIFLDHIRSSYKIDDLIVVAPDAGAAKRAEYYAKSLFGEDNVDETKLVYSIKYRKVDKANTVEKITILGDVSGKILVTPDDMIDTVGTMEKFVDTAVAKGAIGVVFCATHPILSNPGPRRLDRLYSEGKLIEVLTTDSVPQPAGYETEHPKFKSYSIAQKVADMIDRINTNRPTSSLYF